MRNNQDNTEQKHVFSVLVQNQPGVLARVAGMFAARNFNIDSLVVGRTENPELSHMVIVTSGDPATLEQVRKQLGKIVSVVKVRDLSQQNCVERDLLLIQVHCPPERRGELRQITQIFRGSIVDVGPRSVIIQLTGTEAKIEAFVELCRPYGIISLARTGVIAVPRASQGRATQPAAGPSGRQPARGSASGPTAARTPAGALPPS